MLPERGQPCPRVTARMPPTSGLGGPRSFGCGAAVLWQRQTISRLLLHQFGVLSGKTSLGDHRPPATLVAVAVETWPRCQGLIAVRQNQKPMCQPLLKKDGLTMRIGIFPRETIRNPQSYPVDTWILNTEVLVSPINVSGRQGLTRRGCKNNHAQDTLSDGYNSPDPGN